MTYRTLLLSAVAASFAVTANAQEVPSATPDDTNPPAAESVATPSAATAGTEFKVGSAVADAKGADVGVIQSVTAGDTGPTVVLQIDGALYGVPASALTTGADGAVSSKTKAEIKASSKPQK